MSASDESWAEIARATRGALATLGYPITSRCLPDEANPCSGSFSQHAAANFGVLLAIAENELDHIGAAGWEIANEVKAHELASRTASCTHRPES